MNEPRVEDPSPCFWPLNEVAKLFDTPDMRRRSSSISDEKWLSSFRPERKHLRFLFRSIIALEKQRKRITTTLNTRRGNKSPRQAIWWSRTIIRDGAFINGGMRERGPLTPPPFPFTRIGSAVLRGPSWWLRAGQTRPFKSVKDRKSWDSYEIRQWAARPLNPCRRFATSKIKHRDRG